MESEIVHFKLLPHCADAAGSVDHTLKSKILEQKYDLTRCTVKTHFAFHLCFYGINCMKFLKAARLFILNISIEYK